MGHSPPASLHFRCIILHRTAADCPVVWCFYVNFFSTIMQQHLFRDALVLSPACILGGTVMTFRFSCGVFALGIRAYCICPKLRASEKVKIFSGRVRHDQCQTPSSAVYIPALTYRSRNERLMLARCIASSRSTSFFLRHQVQSASCPHIGRVDLANPFQFFRGQPFLCPIEEKCAPFRSRSRADPRIVDWILP